MFNLCFVFESDTRTAKYEPTVRKLATYLTQLEVSLFQLFTKKGNGRLPETKSSNS